MTLAADHVTRRFLRKRGAANYFNAVDDVSLALENKKITVITGPSGSGKSTLLNMMAGILAPTSGAVRMDGTDLYSMDDAALSAFRNRHIGVVPQGQTAIPSLTLLDNVLLPYTLLADKQKKTAKAEKKRGSSSVKGRESGDRPQDAGAAEETGNGAGREFPDPEAVRRRAESLLDETGIGDLTQVMPSELSGGEQRRMAVVRAMLLRPDVMLADEPTADLDEENTKIVLTLMRHAADEGSAVLIVTHDRDVFPWADRVLMLRGGKLSDAQASET